MEMRFARVTGVSDVCQKLTAPHTVSNFYTQAARLKVTVLGELLPAQVKHDGVAGDRVGRYRYSGVESLVMAGNIVRETVPCGRFRAICHCQHGLTIRVVRALVARVSSECCAVIDLLPIDCVPPRNFGAALNDEDSTPV